ncbi:MAG: glycosyltransferase family 2 protein [Lachnospiraceae bacterium]|nr:glycosyltransferase family 2 protein [Lachnospiraceae bacterium]
MSEIAILTTCYNRRESTINCLKSIYENIERDQNNHYRIYVVDDNSTDDTVDAVKTMFPKVNIVVSGGNLYWARGMYAAMKMAYEDNNDYYYMINDDALFRDTAFEIMMSSYHMARRECAIVGSFLSKETGEPTYGGFSRAYKLVHPSEELTPCECANWNCFFVPKTIIDKVGYIDKRYAHGGGDYDYCYMMHRLGLEILVAYDYVGFCERNSTKGTYRDNTLPKIQRMRKLFSRKEFHFPSMFHFYLKNFGIKGLLQLGILYYSKISKIICKEECS